MGGNIYRGCVNTENNYSLACLPDADEPSYYEKRTCVHLLPSIQPIAPAEYAPSRPAGPACDAGAACQEQRGTSVRERGRAGHVGGPILLRAGRAERVGSPSLLRAGRA